VVNLLNVMFVANPLKHCFSAVSYHFPASSPVHLALAEGRYGIAKVWVADAISVVPSEP